MFRHKLNVLYNIPNYNNMKINLKDTNVDHILFTHRNLIQFKSIFKIRNQPLVNPKRCMYNTRVSLSKGKVNSKIRLIK